MLDTYTGAPVAERIHLCKVTQPLTAWFESRSGREPPHEEVFQLDASVALSILTNIPICVRVTSSSICNKLDVAIMTMFLSLWCNSKIKREKDSKY